MDAWLSGEDGMADDDFDDSDTDMAQAEFERDLDRDLHDSRMDDAGRDAFDRWAEVYDDLIGAPEGDWDR